MARIADPETSEAASGEGWPPETVEEALTYRRYQARGGRLNQAEATAKGIPLGSGVTEAACKELVERRLYGSWLTWNETGAATVLAVRCPTSRQGR